MKDKPKTMTAPSDAPIALNDIIQITDESNDWFPCFLVVSEIKNFGVQAYCEVPEKGPAYFRLSWDEFERVGVAYIIRAGSSTSELEEKRSVLMKDKPKTMTAPSDAPERFYWDEKTEKSATETIEQWVSLTKTIAEKNNPYMDYLESKIRELEEKLNKK